MAQATVLSIAPEAAHTVNAIPWDARLPPTTSCHASDLRRVTVGAVQHQDYNLLLELLDNSSQIRPLVALQGLWGPLLLACAPEPSAEVPQPHASLLLHTMRHHVRTALLRLPQLEARCWLVPYKQGLITSTYVAALSLNLCGVGARVWCWQAHAPGPSLSIASLDIIMRYITHAGLHESNMVWA